jgi:Pumilio-family RNA binding repeat
VKTVTCRFLQRKFDEGGPQAVARVLPEILDHLTELMVDPFGNYLIQKLLDRCDEAQRLQVRASDDLMIAALSFDPIVSKPAVTAASPQGWQGEC